MRRVAVLLAIAVLTGTFVGTAAAQIPADGLRPYHRKYPSEAYRPYERSLRGPRTVDRYRLDDRLRLEYLDDRYYFELRSPTYFRDRSYGNPYRYYRSPRFFDEGVRWYLYN